MVLIDFVRILQYIVGSLYVMCVAAYKTTCTLPWIIVGPQLKNFQIKYLFKIDYELRVYKYYLRRVAYPLMNRTTDWI